MKKICTEIYYQLDDGRKVFVKTIHGSNIEMWYVKEVDSKNYRPATGQETRDFALQRSEDGQKF